MGRFTLRDEGKTIAVGKVLKYKPYQKGVVGASTHVPTQKAAAASSQGAVVVNSAPEMVYDMETGEMKPKAKQLAALAEENEEDD
jgi:hypothetical protein